MTLDQGLVDHFTRLGWTKHDDYMLWIEGGHTERMQHAVAPRLWITDKYNDEDEDDCGNGQDDAEVS
jgi:hypothetical protein